MTAFIVDPTSTPLAGDASVPGDKSISHRSLMFGALAAGEVRVRGLGSGVDNARTRAAMEACGVSITDTADGLVIHGAGIDGLRAPAGVIDCGNSGTSIRLLCGLFSGQKFGTTLTGDESLVGRPMRRVIDPLAAMGARIEGQPGRKPGELYPPLTVLGRAAAPLSGIDYALPIASAQVKSALILAALYAGGATRLVEPGPSRDHTERILAHMGAPIRVEAGGVVHVEPSGWDRHLSPVDFDVPGDPSSAAFIVAAGLLAGAAPVVVRNVCVNPTRSGFLDVLAAMGAVVDQLPAQGGAEPTAHLRVDGPPARLRATSVAGDVTVRAIDEVPILAVVAARAEGVTEFRDAAELRVKESDRIATTVAMLRAFGVEVSEDRDGFSVRGTQEPFRSARIDAAGDHRIAMSAAVAALVADGPVHIDDVDNVATSFPSFVDLMVSLGAPIRVLR